jgi:hypothetical protein
MQEKYGRMQREIPGKKSDYSGQHPDRGVAAVIIIFIGTDSITP